MLDRDSVLTIIDDAYAARARGDKDALAHYWAQDASFRISADPAPFQNLTFETDEPMSAISDLIDRFEFSDLERRDAIVEGNRAAIRWEVSITVAGRGTIRTELMDLIELDDDRRIRSLVQFADSAAVLNLMQGDAVPAD
jgi:ketosteroid isomerase-like protein